MESEVEMGDKSYPTKRRREPSRSVYGRHGVRVHSPPLLAPLITDTLKRISILTSVIDSSHQATTHKPFVSFAVAPASHVRRLPSSQ